LRVKYDTLKSFFVPFVSAAGEEMSAMSSSKSAAGAAIRLRVIADRSACCGYGVCAEICPEIFQVDDIGIVSLITDIVPEGLEVKAKEGASACPQSALKVVEEPRD
jgi:ferredoxin